MPLFTITPQDLLFIGDGRPMEVGVGSGGHGARWPAPSVMFDAIHAALWRAFPEPESWEYTHHFGRSGYRNYGDDAPKTKRFGSLTTVGPFPVKEGRWLFPRPLDVTLGPKEHAGSTKVDAEKGTKPHLWLMAPLPENDPGKSDLTLPLAVGAESRRLRLVASRTMPGKAEPAPWWTRAAYTRYLEGTLDGQPDEAGVEDGAGNSAAEMLPHDELFEGEWTTGIGMDAESGSQDGKRIYSAEYLRLKDKVSLGISAALPVGKAPSVEGIDRLWNGSGTVIVGGQQRACHVERVIQGSAAELLPRGGGITGHRVKWVLFSPAVYPAIEAGTDKQGQPLQAHPGGWLPNWICPRTGQVLLKRGAVDRQGQSREVWRVQVRALPGFAPETRLVAARVGKPQVLTGWSDSFHANHHDVGPDGRGSAVGPKPTLLAVPAGSVYYFECASEAEARDLAAALNWHGAPGGTGVVNRRSTLLGEKGFGLGVCGNWNPIVNS
jgi:CRISPR-associated protein Cmr3